MKDRFYIQIGIIGAISGMVMLLIPSPAGFLIVDIIRCAVGCQVIVSLGILYETLKGK